MPNFIMATFGGTPPASPEEGQAFMSRWAAWSGGLTVVSPPTPVGGAQIVGGGEAPVLNGYLVVEADSAAAARDIAAACPHVTALGGSIQVAEIGKRPH